MSRDIVTIGSTMRIPLLYRGEYSQWVERFMNYLEEQTDGEAMINSIKNGDQPLPRVTQVSITGTTSTEKLPLKDKSMWHMLGSEYDEQDKKAAVLYEYETFKATEGELLLDTYIRYLQVINDLKKCGYSKENYELNFKFLNNLYPKWKHDSDLEINANMVFMAQIEKVLSDSEASSSFVDEKISEVSYYLSESKSEYEFKTLEYYDNSSNYGLFVNNDDDQEIFHDAIESASENFIENHIDSQKDHDKSDKRVEKANQQSKDFENQNKNLQDKYDVLKYQTTTFEMNNNELNEQMKELIEKNNDLLAQTKVLKDQLQVKHIVIDTHVECQEKYAKLKAEIY
nr:hypothetical protein [Tanacetum cinerariifolium]